MTDHGERIIAGAKEALEVVSGQRPAVRIYQYGHHYVPEALLHKAQETIASLVKERDALKIESSKHAYEADKAKQDRDTAERRSEDFWSGRVASAEARCARLEEALRWYAEQTRLCRLIHSGGDAARSALADDGGARARQALEEQG